MTIRRALPAVLAVAARALGLAACGEREEPAGSAGAPERVDLVLDYLPNADHAGIYAAIDERASSSRPGSTSSRARRRTRRRR